MDVLKMVEALRARLWDQYGDPLAKPMTQEEVHLTYYLGELLKRRGFDWFKHPAVDGACYSEKATQQAFIAGLRIGLSSADSRAEELAEDRIAAARAALDGL